MKKYARQSKIAEMDFKHLKEEVAAQKTRLNQLSTETKMKAVLILQLNA